MFCLRRDIIRTILSPLNLPFVPIMSFLKKNVSVLLNSLDINTMQLTGYESTVFKIMVWHSYCSISV